MGLPLFEKLDEFWMKRAARWPKRRVPPQVLSGFAGSVASRIREREIGDVPVRRGRPWPAWAAMLAPVAVGVLVFFLVSVQRIFSPGGFEGARTFETASAEASIVAEVETLRALGAWTEDDEAGVSGDGMIELSRAGRPATMV